MARDGKYRSCARTFMVCTRLNGHCVVFPLLYAILRYLKWLGLAIVAIVYYAGLWPNVGGMTLIGVWFFMLGSWCGMNKYDVGGKLARYWPICLVSFIISFGLLLGRGRNRSFGITYMCFLL